MRVLQLIDSLRPGGAEKMAVNIANALLPHVEGSFLCCTRKEGLLNEELKQEVGYLFLNKKFSLDPKAILNLRNFIRENKIDIVHAHSTSFFLAGLLKLSGSRFKLIWHNHYGESENWEEGEYKILKKFSRLFEGIISVNAGLKEWALKNLDCEKVIEIKNFIPVPDPAAIANFQLRGNEDDFKIICVANLRPEKDHFNLVKAFEMLELNTKVSLHLMGEDSASAYSASVLQLIENSPVKNKIFYYGTQKDIISLLKQADMGVLSSLSEGLPLALLEYGIAGLPVVCTNVGRCAEVINNYGRIVEKENSKMLYEGISTYINDKRKMKEEAKLFQQEVLKNYSAKEVLEKYMNFLESDI